MSSGELRFSVLLFGLLQALRVMARRHPAYAKRLAERDFTAQMRTADGRVGRHFTFRGGRIASSRGLHASPDVRITVANAELGARLFTPGVDQRTRAIRSSTLLPGSWPPLPGLAPCATLICRSSAFTR